MKRILLFVLALCACCGAGRAESRTQTNRYRVTVEGLRKDCPVVIADVPAWAESAVVTGAKGEVPSQIDRTLGELAFVADVDGQGDFRVVFSSEPADYGYPARVHAQMWLKNPDKTLQAADTLWSDQDNMYSRLHHHGPAFESEYAAYRVYFDKKQTIDTYGKKLPRLELAQSMWYPTDEQMAADFGYDNLRVFGSVGVGALKGWDAEKGAMTHITDFKRREARILAKGPVRTVVEMRVEGWNYGGREIAMTSRYILYAGHGDVQVENRLEGDVSDLCFTTGVMKMADHRVERGDATVGIFGCDFPENDTTKWVRESVALAIAVPQEQIVGRQDDKTSYLFQLRPDARGHIDYDFEMLWRRSSWLDGRSDDDCLKLALETVARESKPVQVELLGTAEGGARPVHVYLIGDSTCATKKLDKQNPERGWGQMFQPLFDAEVVVENHALNGRSTRSFRAEKRWAPIYDKLQAGDYVFIEFGHNDQKVNTVRYSSPDDYAENLRRYIRETREKGAIPVLLTPIVRRNFVDGVLTDTHGDYLTACRRIAAEEQVAFIDAERITQKWVSELGDEPSKAFFMWIAPGTNPLRPDGWQDDTHLNVRGARTLARMLAAELEGVVPELAAHLDIPDLVVAKDGSGDFFTVGEAIAAIPDFSNNNVIRLRIEEGTYREKIAIPSTKRNVRMEGRGAVTIAWDDYASKRGFTGRNLGTSGSSTVYFGGDNWYVSGITFANTAGRVGQAVAVQCLGNNLQFVDCRFLGNQDTLYLYGTGNRDGETVPENARMHFTRCYVEGTTDFIFGAAEAMFDDCEIRSLADSYVTAASSCKGQPCGFIFRNCRLTAAEGVTRCYLGRPWRDYAQTVFIDCELGSHIRPEGWHDWGKPQAHKRAFYAECGSTGAGAAGERVKWSHRLTPKQAQKVVDAFLLRE